MIPEYARKVRMSATRPTTTIASMMGRVARAQIITTNTTEGTTTHRARPRQRGLETMFEIRFLS